MDVYRIVTDRIVAQLEQGTVPWHRPWKSGGPAGAPRNLASGRPYRGVNVFLLSSLGYSSPWFLTCRQAKERGGHVRAGEHGAPVVFWTWRDKRRAADDGSEECERYAVLQYYTVFNVAQCEGIAAPGVPTTAADVAPIESAERIVAGMPDAPMISHGGNVACYSPSLDVVRMPARAAFDSPEAYYSTLLHELTHATGHARRLNRPTLMDACAFGTTNYSKEELVAEFGAAYLCAIAGIENVATLQNSAAYIAGWLRRLRDDARLVVHAAAQAQRAADYIIGASVEAPVTADDMVAA
jgi:antirestriction protein ArdC